jgi:hypothetical protein
MGGAAMSFALTAEIARRLAAEVAICDALAEAVAQYMAADFASNDEMVAVGELRAALDAYHAHREVWP